MNPSRRAFLTGRRDAVGSRDRPPSITASCLAQRAVECRICGEACGSGAIIFKPRRGGVSQPMLDAARCNGCGDCLAPCPVGAIRIGESV